MSWYFKVLKNYVNFSGRARRKEYWIFNLIHSIILYGLSFIPFNNVAITLIAIYGIATLLPYLAVLVRRLHDTGKSGSWIFISLIPFIGGLLLLIFTCQKSQMDENGWGPSPQNTIHVN